MAKTLKTILNKKSWTPRELGLAVLYNLENDLQHVGENNPPLFSQDQLNKMVSTIGEDGRAELEVYDLLNRTFVNNRNLIKAYLQQALHGYYKYSTCLAELSREESNFSAKISTPLIITQEHYDQLAERLINRIGEEQLSYFEILFKTLDYFLEEYRSGADTLPEVIKLAIIDTKVQPVTNPRIIENFIKEMQLGYYVETEGKKSVIVPVEDIEHYREERDKDKPKLTAEQQLELKIEAARIVYQGELAVIEKLRTLPDFILAEYPKMDSEERGELLAQALQYELYPDTKSATPPTFVTMKELPPGISKYNIISDALELYNGSTENFFKGGYHFKATAREQAKEFKKDYPALYAALDAYIRERIPATAELKANQLHKPIITMNELLHSQYVPIMGYFNFDNIQLQELFPSDSEEDFITRMKIFNGVAILSDPPTAYQKATAYKRGIYEPVSFENAFISFEDLIEHSEVCSVVTSAYESLENAVRMIYAYNALCEILLDLFDIPFLKVIYEDIGFLEHQIKSINRMIYVLYITPPGSPAMQKQAREAMKEYLRPIDVETFKPSKEKIARLKARMFYALQEGQGEIKSYLLASRQLMQQLGAEEGAE